MLNTSKRPPRTLGELEQLLMEFIWLRGPSTAEACRAALLPARALKDSTIRTVLRRLEEKGLLRHQVEGRTFFYQATQPRGHFAARAVQHIIDSFCGGSVEQLLVGMVENKVLKQKDLEQLARRITRQRGEKK
jgi:predicted transcriptional regulator